VEVGTFVHRAGGEAIRFCFEARMGATGGEDGCSLIFSLLLFVHKGRVGAHSGCGARVPHDEHLDGVVVIL